MDLTIVVFFWEEAGEPDPASSSYTSLQHSQILLPPVRQHHQLPSLLSGREEVGSAVFCSNLNAVSAFSVSHVLQSSVTEPLHICLHVRRHSHKAGTDTLNSTIIGYLWL